MTVTSPEALVSLKQGRIGSVDDVVVVDWDAHPNVLSLPIEFANKPYHVISFVDRADEFGSNTITLFPQRRRAGATFHSGANVTHGIPPNYSEYMLNFHTGSNVFTDNLDNILQWKEAKRLEIYDNMDNDVAFKLSQRVNDLSVFTKLRKLSLNIHRNTYQLLNLSAFLETLPVLKEAYFFAQLSFVEVVEYTRDHLANVTYWKCKANDGYGRPYIHCVSDKN